MLLGDRFEEALVYAARLHARQTRKSRAVPYVSHLLAVASIVLEHGGDEDEAIAALLHDAAEDQGGEPTLAELRRRFGDRVAGIVLACSDSLAADPSRKEPWRERKLRYLAHLVHADSSARLISAADKLHNIRCLLADHRRLGDRVFDHFSGRREGTVWYYDAVLSSLLSHGESPLLAELDRAVDELAALAGMSRPVAAP